MFIIPADIAVAREADRSWRWTAADSPEIPETLHPRFRTTDECKPVGPYILITSSADGVALVRREDKRCVFHTTARNAHSACLLPDERVAVAASTGGDELLRKSPGIKSVHEHLTLPAVVYHQATETTWWSDRIRFLAPDHTIHLPNQRIYKVRWDIDQGLPR